MPSQFMASTPIALSFTHVDCRWAAVEHACHMHAHGSHRMCWRVLMADSPPLMASAHSGLCSYAEMPIYGLLG